MRTIEPFLVSSDVDEARPLVRVAVVILSPGIGGQQVRQRGHRLPPRRLGRHLQPFAVLVGHRVDDRDEGLVAGKESVPAGLEVALQPALAGVLAQDLHHPAVGADEHRVAARVDRPGVGAVGRPRRPRREDSSHLVGTDDAEVRARLAATQDLGQVAPGVLQRARRRRPGTLERHSEVALERVADQRAGGAVVCGFIPMR